MSAWVLPDHIADVLPSEARHIEELRRDLLDTARSYGYELVIPPLLEHLESLLTGTGEALDLQTFKLVDQLSGRMLGLRADTTPQVARIDAHLLNRKGVTRLCYCGPVVHTRPGRAHATREPLQFGAEIYGHAGIEADLEVLRLSLECVRAAPVEGFQVDLGDARIPRVLLQGLELSSPQIAELHAALAAKDGGALFGLTRNFPAEAREALRALVHLYGDISILDEAENVFHAFPSLTGVLSGLRRLARTLPAGKASFDLADVGGYAYYSGARFAIYVAGASDALVRGGRYDEVGAIFGRTRPAVGFSLDVRELVGVVQRRELRAAIRAPWADDVALGQAIGALRAGGETVVCVMPGHESEVDEFRCDRELVHRAGAWTVQSL